MASFASWSQAPPTSKHLSPSQDRKDQPKKPRHRHSAFQLAALNELYDKNEHPSLEERTALAERLGMETKTVNSWFQNKRASCKKRTTKGSSSSSSAGSTNSIELPPIAALIASVSAPPSTFPMSEYEEYSEDELPRQSAISEHSQHQSLFYAGNTHHRHLYDVENTLPRKARSRPSAAQTEELRKLYDMTPHPSKEEREELGERIGMRYQSVTNWFQNQRSIAKKRKEDADAQGPALASKSLKLGESSHSSRPISPFPPTAGIAHPSLSVPPATGHPSLSALTNPHRGRHLSGVSRPSPNDSRPSSPRVSPYRAPTSERAFVATHSRPRRTRPEPYQLEALKKLFRRTATPSIEERGAIALEIGMDVGKVTNWFRNLRQTARKRAQRGVADMDEDMDDMEDDVSLATYHAHSRSVSRAGTPVYSAMSPSQDAEDVPMDLEDGEIRVELETANKRRRMYVQSTHSHSHSDMASDEDFQEAVTPSPSSTPPPPVYAPVVSRAGDFKDLGAVDALTYAELEKASAQFHTGVKVEDALLLLSFHKHVVR
ncbi:homeobox-domain-containing protein [Obba rivulosa]|uniref:Homeobox-domain-containing protein n=1 Tax=Obba rivulosa TaxID=1052685 RepID=A0A8E2DTQ2_9APHY|nr:homeobox-domain-containing protein [Obba rivulosa]